MSECDGKHWEKRGQMLSCSIFLDHVTRGYGLRLRTSREEDEMTISNTRTVRSGRFLTTPSIRWSRFFMTAHSYAVTFHCILINTWLNQARTTLLITQDKKTRQRTSWIIYKSAKRSVTHHLKESPHSLCQPEHHHSLSSLTKLQPQYLPVQLLQPVHCLSSLAQPQHPFLSMWSPRTQHPHLPWEHHHLQLTARKQLLHSPMQPWKGHQLYYAPRKEFVNEPWSTNNAPFVKYWSTNVTSRDILKGNILRKRMQTATLLVK